MRYTNPCLLYYIWNLLRLSPGGSTWRKWQHLAASWFSRIECYTPVNCCTCFQTRACSVVGCPDIVPQDGSSVVRHGDTATVRCVQTGETFYVTCLDTQWRGELSACSGGLIYFCFFFVSLFWYSFCPFLTRDNNMTRKNFLHRKLFMDTY